MNTQSRSPKPQALDAPDTGTVLVLAPHAHDEIVGCGGTLCLHAEQGDRVHVLVAFAERADDGADSGGGERIERDRAEARARGALLGACAYEFWAHPEGHDPEPVLLQSAARRLAERLAALDPRTVYAPWIGEHPIDHHLLARATRLALELAEFTGRAWGYEAWTPLVPTRILDITRVWEKKRAAIAGHAEQHGSDDAVHRVLGLNAQRSLYLARHARYGEAFAPLQRAPEPARSST